MIENSISIEAAKFIRESLPGVKLYEMRELIGKPPATSENFRNVTGGGEFHALIVTGIERRFVMRNKSSIGKFLDLPSSVILPQIHDISSGLQVLEIPSDSIFVDHYNSHNLESNDENQMAYRIPVWKQQLIDMNRSLIVKLKEKYGKNLKLEDFLTSSMSNSSLIFLG